MQPQGEGRAMVRAKHETLRGIFFAAMFMAVLITILMVVGMNIRNSPTASAQPGVSSPAQNKPTITKAEFDQVQNGMTYTDATAIIGGPGELSSELRTPGAPYTMAYTFAGEGNLGANAMLMWQDGKLVMKSQAGLK